MGARKGTVQLCLSATKLPETIKLLWAWAANKMDNLPGWECFTILFFTDQKSVCADLLCYRSAFMRTQFLCSPRRAFYVQQHFVCSLLHWFCCCLSTEQQRRCSVSVRTDVGSGRLHETTFNSCWEAYPVPFKKLRIEKNLDSTIVKEGRFKLKLLQTFHQCLDCDAWIVVTHLWSPAGVRVSLFL